MNQLALKHAQIADTLMLEGQWEAAQGELDISISLDKTIYITFYARGFCKYKLGNDESALADIDISISLGNADLEIHKLRASLLSVLERHVEAIKEYGVILSKYPTEGSVYLLRGICRCQLEKPEIQSAKDDFQKALAFGEDEARYWLETIITQFEKTTPNKSFK